MSDHATGAHKKLKIIGITGTKTTTTHILFHLLKTAQIYTAFISTVGNAIGDTWFDRITTDNPRHENPETIVADIMRGIPAEQRDAVICEPDRKKAIERAYSFSHKGSIIALLGKGPDEYQLMGDQKIPFSERSILQKL